MSDLRDLLREHVEAVEDKPVTWGADDCTMWAAGWFERVNGYALDLEPYGSLEEAHVLIGQAGSLADLWSGALEDHLSEQYVDPQFGDVGVITSRLYGQVGGIFGDDGVMFWRSERGTALLRPRPNTIVKVWAISC